jgi:hypothetical protein
MDLVLFPSSQTYSYLKTYIRKYKFENPIFAYYNFKNSEECELSFEQDHDVQLRLKTCLKFVQKFCEDNNNQKIRVYLFTPNISYYYDKDLDLRHFLTENIVEFNYIVKECEKVWTNDFNNEWMNDSRIKFSMIL